MSNTEDHEDESFNATKTLALGMACLVGFLVFIYFVAP